MCDENQFPLEPGCNGQIPALKGHRNRLLQSIPQTSNQELVRHFLLGDYGAIQRTIHVLGALRYAEPQHWSPLVPTNRTGEYISVLTRREAANIAPENPAT